MKIKIITINGQTLQNKISSLLKSIEKDVDSGFSNPAHLEEYVMGCIKSVVSHSIVEVA